MVGIQGHVAANGQEVVAFSDCPHVVFRFREQLEAVERARFQVRGEHERPRGGYHEDVSRLETHRRTLAVDGKPARTLHDGGQLDVLGVEEI